MEPRVTPGRMEPGLFFGGRVGVGGRWEVRSSARRRGPGTGTNDAAGRARPLPRPAACTRERRRAQRAAVHGEDVAAGHLLQVLVVLRIEEHDVWGSSRGGARGFFELEGLRAGLVRGVPATTTVRQSACQSRSCPNRPPEPTRVALLLRRQLRHQHGRVVAGGLGAAHAARRGAVDLLLHDQVDRRELAALGGGMLGVGAGGRNRGAGLGSQGRRQAGCARDGPGGTQQAPLPRRTLPLTPPQPSHKP
jgi:hypothetical protein